MKESSEKIAESYEHFLSIVRQFDAEAGKIEPRISDKIIEAGNEFDTETDRLLSEELKEIAPTRKTATYKYHQVENGAEEKAIFFAALAQSESYEPQFTYKNPNTPTIQESGQVLANLKEFRSEIGRDTPLARLYTRQSIYASRAVILATLSQTSAFAQASKKLYGTITTEEREVLSRRIKEHFKQGTPPQQPDVDAQEMKIVLAEIYREIGLETKVRIKKTDQMTASTSAASKTASIREDYEEPLSEAVKQLMHEPGHSILQTRGKKHPCKATSMKSAGSLQLEEGVNMALEEIIFEDLHSHMGLTRDLRDVREIIPEIRAVAVSIAEEHSFCETFQALKELGVSDELAWTTTLRVKRGLADVSKPGANHKDVSYYKGYMTVLRELGETKTKDEKLEVLDGLSQGRLSLAETRYLEKMRMTNPTLSLVELYPKVSEVLRKFIKAKTEPSNLRQ